VCQPSSSSAQRIAELRGELAAVQREIVSAASIQRAVALLDPIWDLLLVPERFRILHLLLESVVYDGGTGELELSFYPLGVTSLAAEAAMIGQPDAEAACCGRS
jgi:site-specific DNA recombinase